MAFRTWDLKNEKRETGPAGVDPKPMTEGRRKTLDMETDAIIHKTMDEIIRGGVWEYTAEVKTAEEEITKAYLKVLDGSGSLCAFQEVCTRWKQTGTKRSGGGFAGQQLSKPGPTFHKCGNNEDILPDRQDRQTSGRVDRADPANEHRAETRRR